MTFDEILEQAIALLQRRRRLTYRALKRQFNLDNDYLDDLKEELIYGQKLAVDEDSRVLVWIGETASATSPPASIPASAPGADQQPPPLSYTPQYLTEKILTSRNALAGERKQVTVLFADIKDSTELIRDLDPEDAQKLLDPAIVLSATTLRLVEGLVQVDDLGPIPVKGMDEPVAVYELLGASRSRRCLQAAISRGLTKFVGRDTELAALKHALERAHDGYGQIVAAVGEAGVGKSRLVYEFVHSHRTQGWLVLESASVSYGKATPYFPVIDLLKRYVHVEDGDDARTIRAKVTGYILTLDESLQETIPALLSLLER